MDELAAKHSLDITVTGPASAAIDIGRLATPDCQLRAVNERSAVVLIAVFGDIEPTRTDLDLVNAVSQATGRCAVALVGDDSARETEAARTLWRQAVPLEIPVGYVDEKMGRTLFLLAQGPARAHGSSAIRARQQLLQEQLLQERSRRAEQRAENVQRQRRHVAEVIHNSIERFVDLSHEDYRRHTMGEDELQQRCEAIAKEAQDFLGKELGEDCHLAIPRVPNRERSVHLLEFVVGIMVFGAAVGVGRLLAEPLRWAGMSSQVSGFVAAIFAVLIAVVVVWGNVRRKAQRAQREWIARYAGVIRRAWERQIEQMLQQLVEASSVGWRARQLAEALHEQ